MFSAAIGLGYAQLTFRGAKLIAALSGVMIAVILMFIQLGFKGALYDSAVSAPMRFNADIILASKLYQTMAFPFPWMSLHYVQDAEAVDGVASATPFYATTVTISSPRNGRSQTSWVLAFPPAASVFLDPMIDAQRDELFEPDTAIIDADSRNEIGELAKQVQQTGPINLVFPTANLTIQPVFRIVGTFKVGPTIFIDGNVITSDLNYYRFLGVPLDRVGLGIVKVKPGYSVSAVKAALQQRFGDQVRVFDKQGFIENEQNYYATQTPIGFIFNAGLIMGVIVGIVFISQVLHGIVSDNMREYATLRAMGYSQGFFLTIVTFISTTVAVATYIPAAIISYFLYQVAANGTKLPMVMKPSYLIEVFLLIVIMGLIATMLTAKKLRQADPVDLF